MTATDELHRLLTAAGVEYRFNDATKVFEWHFDGTDGEGFAQATEAHGGINIIACSLTPEQAIAATLGMGTCHADETDVIKCWVKCKDEPSTEHVELIHIMECSACGGTYEHVNGSYEFCPRCGRRVEVDE